MKIIIFKTSVQNDNELKRIRRQLNNLLGKKNWTFAFEDVDKILRAVCAQPAVVITQLLADHGFYCEELPYSLD